jgi:hypothetical protein
MYIAGLGANFEYDLKKDYCSFYLESVGFVVLAFFHLLTHA